MKNFFYKLCFFLILTLVPLNLNAEVLKKTEVYGNERIAIETVIVYGGIEKGKDYSQEDINDVKGIASSLGNLGIIYSDLGEISKAHDY